MTSLGASLRTLTVVKKIASIGPRILFAGLLLLTATVSFAQPRSTSQVLTTKSAPQNASTSKLAQKLQKPESAFSIGGSISHSKPAREEKYAFTILTLGANYKVEDNLAHKTSMGASLEYDHIWTEYKDERRDSELESADLSIERTSEFSKILSMSYGLEIGVPVNKADATAGFNGAASVPLSITWKFGSQFLTFGLTPKFYSYKYKTSTEDGSDFNKKLSGLARLGLTSKFTEKFSWSNSVGFYEYQNYSGFNYQTYSLGSYLKYKLAPGFIPFFGIASNDRVITTNSVLADDVTYARAGFDWSY